MKEYVVTLKKGQDIEAFYNDMETEGGSLYIPNRAVECKKRRPLSRNTHYWLIDEEAEEIKKDERVLAVDLTPKEKGYKVRLLYTQTSASWDKSVTQDSSDINWGLLRCVEGTQRDGWGYNSTPSVSGSINVTSSGKNVDVVVVDGHIDPTHPELDVNSNGTGGSRVNQINWYSDYASILGTDDIENNYDYNSVDAASNNHGTHVAGTIGGNTQGWARECNIYNISPWEPNLNENEIYDYVRAFHLTKPINPITGRRNPTICNNSWGYSITLPITFVTAVTFRGTGYSNMTFDEATLNDFGIKTDSGNFIVPINETSVDADIEDAIDDGIIFVGAAGNDNTKIAILGDRDYDNELYYDYLGYPYRTNYNRYASPGGTPGVICVGAISNHAVDVKASYSNSGPRIDIYAPGTAIQSSLRDDDFGGIYPSAYFPLDTRSASHYIGKIQGTSMASPQVCGVLACLLEQEPELTQSEALARLLQYCGTNQISDPNLGLNDRNAFDLQGSFNRYLRYINLRQETGAVYPRSTFKPRPFTGAMFPRRKVNYK